MSHQTLRALFEIRLRWTDKVLQEAPTQVNGGLWVPDTPRNRERLQQAAALGDRLHGHETHWIERRQA
ncbi:hypothetical protein LJR084_002976 [Variovorax sp. LjRoot84]|uniref:hypothetical protein n=1 Tax=unclassified Variovorax TaxID=663243 RepID=UPI0011145C50|nr:hypothetical protein [Variovorax sp. CF079]